MPRRRAPTAALRDELSLLTGTMRILGTPLYMSPERIRNPGDADGRADIYALGAVAFFMLTGRRLFETETEHDLTYQVLHTVPRLASACSPFAVPTELDALIGRCLEKEVAGRPQTIGEAAAVLEGCCRKCRGRPPRSMPGGRDTG